MRTVYLHTTNVFSTQKNIVVHQSNDNPLFLQYLADKLTTKCAVA